MTQPNSQSPDYILVDLILDMLQTGTADYVQGLLNANRDFGNGIEGHILTCRRCQRKLYGLVTQ